MTKRELEAKINDIGGRVTSAMESSEYLRSWAVKELTDVSSQFCLLYDYLGVEVKHDAAKTYLVKKGKREK